MIEQYLRNGEHLWITEIGELLFKATHTNRGFGSSERIVIVTSDRGIAHLLAVLEAVLEGKSKDDADAQHPYSLSWSTVGEIERLAAKRALLISTQNGLVHAECYQFEAPTRDAPPGAYKRAGIAHTVADALQAILVALYEPARCIPIFHMKKNV